MEGKQNEETTTTQAPEVPAKDEPKKEYTSCSYASGMDAIKSSGGCPVNHETLDPKNNMPPPNQQPHPEQKKRLPTERMQSSIPKGGNDESTWSYPSEQMFFNAMKKKEWNPEEDDMRAVVAIHNAVNERTWQQILEWESKYKEACGKPKLVQFAGRPYWLLKGKAGLDRVLLRAYGQSQ
eukprot:Colp12_sorted_trinity150504_noHs@15669